MLRPISFQGQGCDKGKAVALCRNSRPIRHFGTAPQKLSPRILITGGLGQIGVELAASLRAKYGKESVIWSDISYRRLPDQYHGQGPFVYADVAHYASLERAVVEYGITWLIHNSSVLSAAGERDPPRAMRVNIDGLHNALELARIHNLRIFAPSSIAGLSWNKSCPDVLAFGPTTPREDTPDLTIMRPTTIYGVTKVYLELLGEYYHKKWGVDFRCLRYPGIISSETLPGGGTTDYAVDIFYKALQENKYECFLKSDSNLPMMYMPDCLKATISLLEADPARLRTRTFNVAAFSFSPAELATSIQKFQITYKPDFRQAIADSWPKSLNDANARTEWGWKPQYNLDGMTKDMLEKLAVKLGVPYRGK